MSNRKPWLDRAEQLLGTHLQRAFTGQQLIQLLQTHRDELDVPASLAPTQLIDQLIEHSNLKSIEVHPDALGRGRTGQPYPTRRRYTWGKASPYSIALSLRAGSYFTHASAINLLGLSNEIPRTIYVNKEQSAKPHPAELTQSGITKAFSNAPRTSKFIYAFDAYRIVLLSGKHTGQLGVEEILQGTGELFPSTNLERTLIDSVVRPQYVGGLHHLRRVFEFVRDKLSVDLLLSTLKKMDFAYPYHQSIGFLMERTGYPPAEHGRFREPGLNYDFYLTHKIADQAYDASWRIYYPRGF